jgi:arginase family enzyme
MTQVPTFAVPPAFLGIERTHSDAALCVAGIPYDLGTSNRPGARFGPGAIRRASRMLVDGDHPMNWGDPAALDLADIGDFRIAYGDILGSLTDMRVEMDEGQGAATGRQRAQQPERHRVVAAERDKVLQRRRLRLIPLSAVWANPATTISGSRRRPPTISPPGR